MSDPGTCFFMRKEPHGKGHSLVTFYFYEMSPIGRSMDMDSRSVVAQGWGGQCDEWLLHGHQASLWDDENLRWMDLGSGETCTTSWTFSKPNVVWFKLVKMVDFTLSDFSSIKIMHLNRQGHIEMPIFTWYEQRAKGFTIYGLGENKTLSKYTIHQNMQKLQAIGRK